MLTTGSKNKPSRKQSANPNVIPYDVYYQSQDENKGDDLTHSEARLDAILLEQEAVGIKLIRLLGVARRRCNFQEVASLEIELEKHAKTVIRTRQLARDFRAQGSHALQQVANMAVRRVPQAFEDPPHLEDSHRTAQDKRVHLKDPMDAEREYRTLGEPRKYGAATQTHQISESFKKTCADEQLDRAHFQDLVDAERGYRTQEVIPRDNRQHTDIHERRTLNYLLIKPHDVQSKDQVYHTARQCCQCSAVRIKIKSMQRCCQCSHIMSGKCIERPEECLLRVEIDAQGKFGVVWLP